MSPGLRCPCPPWRTWLDSSRVCVSCNCFRLRVKYCPVTDVRVTLLISVSLCTSRQHRGSHAPKLPFTSVLLLMLPWHLILLGCGVRSAPLTKCLLLRQPPLLVIACVIICARRLPSPGRLLWPRTLLRTTSQPGGIGVALAPPHSSTLLSARSSFAPLCGRSCTLALLWCSLSSVSSLAGSHTAILWTETPFPCMDCVRDRTARCEVPITAPPPGTAGGYTLTVFSTICSVAKLMVARTLLISGRTCGTSRRLLACMCTWHFPVHTSEKHLTANGEKACRSNFAQGKNELDDWLTEVPPCLRVHGHKSVTRVRMFGVCRSDFVPLFIATAAHSKQ
jgi:hypothetical protein